MIFWSLDMGSHFIHQVKMVSQISVILKKEQDFAASCRTTFNRIFLSILYKNGNNAALQTKEVPDKATACTQLKRRVNLQWL